MSGESGMACQVKVAFRSDVHCSLLKVKYTVSVVRSVWHDCRVHFQI